MKKPWFLLASLSAVLLCGCGGSSGGSGQSVSLTKSNYSTYLGTSSSYVEHGSDKEGYYLTFTLSVYSLSSSYRFVDVKFTATNSADGKKYSLPTNGNTTVSYNTKKYPDNSAHSYYLVKLYGGSIYTISGTVKY